MNTEHIYQYKQQGRHFRKMALDQAQARHAIAELEKLGFIVTHFRLGPDAAIIVQHPVIKGDKPLPLQFVPTGYGFNGLFRYTRFAAVYGDWSIEWHKRDYH